jgi:hypothetical protein
VSPRLEQPDWVIVVPPEDDATDALDAFKPELPRHVPRTRSSVESSEAAAVPAEWMTPAPHIALVSSRPATREPVVPVPVMPVRETSTVVQDARRKLQQLAALGASVVTRVQHGTVALRSAYGLATRTNVLAGGAVIGAAALVVWVAGNRDRFAGAATLPSRPIALTMSPLPNAGTAVLGAAPARSAASAMKSPSVSAAPRVSASAKALPPVTNPIVAPRVARSDAARPPVEPAARLVAPVLVPNEQVGRSSTVAMPSVPSASSTPAPGSTSPVVAAASPSRAVGRQDVPEHLRFAEEVIYDESHTDVTPPAPDGSQLVNLPATDPRIRLEALNIVIVVNPDGRVGSAKGALVPQNMSEFMMLTGALSAVKSWRYHPAVRNGVPVAYRLIVPLGSSSRFAP